MGFLRYPGLSALGGAGIVEVSGFGQSYLVLNIKFAVAFTQDEHPPWL